MALATTCAREPTSDNLEVTWPPSGSVLDDDLHVAAESIGELDEPPGSPLQVQVPPLHAPLGQVLPQLPQLAGSVAVSMQAFPQQASGRPGVEQ